MITLSWKNFYFISAVLALTLPISTSSPDENTGTKDSYPKDVIQKLDAVDFASLFEATFQWMPERDEVVQELTSKSVPLEDESSEAYPLLEQSHYELSQIASKFQTAKEEDAQKKAKITRQLETRRKENRGNQQQQQQRQQTQQEDNQEVTQSSTQSEATVQGNSSSSSEEVDPLFLVLTLCLIFLVLEITRFSVAKFFDPLFRDALFCLYRTTAVMLFAIGIYCGVYYATLFETEADDQKADRLFVGFMFFMVAWALIGVIIIILGQAFSWKWFKLERESEDGSQSLVNYELYYKRANDPDNPTKAEDNKLLRKQQAIVNYGIMRHIFIAPYLPILTECFLRDDFEFAEYLTRGLVKIFKNLFDWTWVTLVAAVSYFMIAGLALEGSKVTQFSLVTCVPVVFFLMQLSLLNHLKGVFQQLVPQVESPYAISFPGNETLRHASINIGNVSPPLYLRAHEGRSHPHLKERGCSGLFFSRKPNRHECLFYFDALGPDIFKFFMQFTLISTCAWISVFSIMYKDEIWTSEGILFGLLATLALLSTIASVFFSLPQTLRLLTLTTHIEMMKDRDLVQEVVSFRRTKITEVFLHFYKIVKDVRKELLKKNPETEDRNYALLRPYITNLVREGFKRINNDHSKSLKSHKISELIRLCGMDLKIPEVYMLVKNSADDDVIEFESLIDAIEGLFLDVEQDPYMVVFFVMTSFFRRKNLKITIDELRNFLFSQENEYSDIGMMCHDDTEILLKEAGYLVTDNGMIRIEEFASLVRDNIEGFAR
eukprot:CAMPEP_0115000040 /NCGR_PEP_ID=MMETSP0216-20121206/16514_1 /TAXON_ID=223996 /ORGANISM="Protocruzia adherens, Strain Boccale" /LENGTH=773 /DNA_ID=CAMNT_0002365049 /DNA_START=198 /DNA_END=2519 /DNA_ORIENTATION=+